MERKDHWEHVYATKADDQVSWFESVPETSIRLIEAAGLTAATCILDVGGGDSRLVDALLARGVHCLAVLDVSGAALARARTRLGSARDVPAWIEADVTGPWSWQPVDIWHDRAVFHFLVGPHDRAKYLERLLETVKVGGTVIIATFALDGPARCSGLPVARYSGELLAETLGEPFSLIESRVHRHRTPAGTEQSFQYSRFVRVS